MELGLVHFARGTRASRARGLAPRRRQPHPLWIDLGADDPFHDAALAYARQAGVHAHVWPGEHDSAFWDAHMPALLRFFARACA